jgi:hypothetical protein
MTGDPRLGMSLVGAAKFFAIDERMSRRWATGDYDIPVANALALEMMYRFKVTPAPGAQVARPAGD